MPVSTNYGSTGRPPGEFHLRHSSKNSSNIFEFPSTPFDIFFTEFANNNKAIRCYDNGGTKTPITLSVYDDNKEAATAHSIHRTDKIIEWFDLVPNINNNNKSISNSSITTSTSSTTTTTPTIDYNTSTYDDNNKANIIAHSIHRTDKIIEWFDLVSNNSNNAVTNNNNNNNKFETPSSTNTTTTTTIDYNTSTNDNDKDDKEYASNNSRLVDKPPITLAPNHHHNNNSNNSSSNKSSSVELAVDNPTTIATAATTPMISFTNNR